MDSVHILSLAGNLDHLGRVVQSRVKITGVSAKFEFRNESLKANSVLFFLPIQFDDWVL